MATIERAQTGRRPFGENWTGRFDRLWRLIGTAISFAAFGLGGLVMALIVFPLMNLLIRDKARRWDIAQTSVHLLWRLFVALMKGLGVLTYEIRGAEKLRAARGVVVVANHPTLIDVVLLMAFMRRTRAVVKEGVWRNPFMSGVVAAANYIPNHRDPQRLVDDCVDALKSGANLCIFPEGSRTPPGRPRKYQRGFAYAAIAAGAPVLLATITCRPPTLLKGEPWYRIPDTRPHWVIDVREQIDTAANYGTDPSVTAARRLTGDVANRIEGWLST